MERGATAMGTRNRELSRARRNLIGTRFYGAWCWGWVLYKSYLIVMVDTAATTEAWDYISVGVNLIGGGVAWLCVGYWKREINKLEQQEEREHERSNQR